MVRYGLIWSGECGTVSFGMVRCGMAARGHVMVGNWNLVYVPNERIDHRPTSSKQVHVGLICNGLICRSWAHKSQICKGRGRTDRQADTQTNLPLPK